jgi:membrane-associated phospholipid phosphatase
VGERRWTRITAGARDPLLSIFRVSLAVKHSENTPAPMAAHPLVRRSWLRFQAYKWSLGFLVAVVGLTIYQVMGRVDLGRSTAMLDTALDRAIPLLPWTTWFYEPFYLGVFVIGTVAFSSRRIYNRALCCVLVNMLVAALGHFFIRAEYPRPVLHLPYPDLSTAFLAFVYKIDPPGNVFPSLHVAHAFALSFLLRLDRPRLGAVTLTMSTLLALSTLTTKQHFVADVIAGLAMALALRAWSLSLFRRERAAPALTSQP